MHDLNIMHRDLKSANVFLYKDFTAKLGDMNVSKVANKRGLKSGEMNLTTSKVIFGLSAVLSMK